jgi:holo-[acyl-carrier protein] synthase
MVVGLGVDIVEIDRIREAMKNPRFIEKVLTPMEREFCTSVEKVAGRWAAKEAILKAIGISFSFQEIEILPDELGVPKANIKSHKYDHKRLRLNISISHERKNAVAIAVLERTVLHVQHIL